MSKTSPLPPADPNPKWRFQSIEGCSFRAVLITFILLMLIGMASLYFVWWKIGWAKPQVSFGSSPALSFGGSPKISPSATYTVSIANAELTQVIRQAKVDRMSDMAAVIHPNGIEVTGKYEGIVSLPLKVIVKPKVINNNISIEVLDATVGGIRVMPIITSQVRQKINDSLNSYISSQFHGKISAVALEEGKMVVSLVTLN